LGRLSHVINQIQLRKILGSPVLHLQVRQRGLGVIVTDQIYSVPALNVLVRTKPQQKLVEITKKFAYKQT
jgi:hypothetical protein